MEKRFQVGLGILEAGNYKGGIPCEWLGEHICLSSLDMGTKIRATGTY